MSFRIRQSYLLSLMADEPARAREELDYAAAQWSHQGFQLQHYFHLVGEAEISLYSGAATKALTGLLQRWRALERSLLLRTVQLFRIEAHCLRARCAIAAAGGRREGNPESERLLESALAEARRVAKESTPWGNPLARLIEAAVAAHRADREETASLLSAAERDFDTNDMVLYSSATRRALGIVLGGEEGRDLVESADEWMAGQKIRNPERMTSMLVPGPWTAAT